MVLGNPKGSEDSLLIEALARMLVSRFSDDPKKIVYWLFTPNSKFGGIKPAWLVMMKPKRLYQYLCDYEFKGEDVGGQG